MDDKYVKDVKDEIFMVIDNQVEFIKHGREMLKENKSYMDYSEGALSAYDFVKQIINIWL